jgi:hypothetical protein
MIASRCRAGTRASDDAVFGHRNSPNAAIQQNELVCGSRDLERAATHIDRNEVKRRILQLRIPH